MTAASKSFSKLQWLKRTDGHAFKPAEFRVLVAIFNHSNGEGRDSYPGLERIAKEACVTESTASHALKSLREQGWIHEVTKGNGFSGKYSKFELVPDAPRPHTSAEEQLHTCATAQPHTCSPAQTNQILITDHGTDPRELRASEGPKHVHDESLPLGGQLPSEGSNTPRASEDPRAKYPRWDYDPFVATRWPRDKPVPDWGDPDIDWSQTHVCQETGELLYEHSSSSGFSRGRWVDAWFEG